MSICVSNVCIYLVISSVYLYPRHSLSTLVVEVKLPTVPCTTGASQSMLGRWHRSKQHGSPVTRWVTKDPSITGLHFSKHQRLQSQGVFSRCSASSFKQCSRFRSHLWLPWLRQGHWNWLERATSQIEHRVDCQKHHHPIWDIRTPHRHVIFPHDALGHRPEPSPLSHLAEHKQPIGPHLWRVLHDFGANFLLP